MYTPTSDTPLATVLRRNIDDIRKNIKKENLLLVKELQRHGFIYINECQTGTGKTYDTTAFMLDEMVRTFYIELKCIKRIAESIRNIARICKDVRHKITLEKTLLEYEACNTELYSFEFLERISSDLFETEMSFTRSKKFLPDNVEELCNLAKDIMERIEKIKSVAQTAKPIVFITGTRHTLFDAKDTLVRHIENSSLSQVEKAFCHKHIVRIKGNAEHLENVVSKELSCNDEYTVENLVKLFEKRSEIRESWECIKYDIEAQHASVKRSPRFDRDLSTLYRHLYNGIRDYRRAEKKSGNKIEVKVCDSNTKLVNAMSKKLVPGSRIMSGESRVIFMTTKKYMLKTYAFPTSVHFPLSFKQHMLIIDEIDRQNGEILSTLLAKDVFNLASTIRQFSTVGLSGKLETNSERYHGVHEIMAEGIRVAQDAVSNWNLDQNFDFHSSFDVKAVHLFASTGYNHGTSLDSENEKENRKVCVISDKHRTKNFLIKENPECDEQQYLTRVVSSLSETYKACLNAVSRSIYTIITNERVYCDRVGIPFNYTIDQTIKDLVKQLDLEFLEKAIFAQMFENDGVRYSVKPDELSPMNYHIRGFKYCDISPAGGATNCLDFKTFNIGYTPTGFLASLVSSGAEIVGVSATATSGSVVHNFDYNALKELLCDRFAEASESDKKALYQYYCSKRQYEKNGVKINASFIGADIKKLKSQISRHEAIAVNKLKTIYKKSTLTDCYHALDVAVLISAVEEFLASKHGRYMVCLNSRTIGKDQEECTFVEELITLIASKKYDIGVEVFSGVNSEKLKNGTLNKVRSTLKHTRKRVIVLSTYATLGDGKNLDYKVSLEEAASLIFVSDKRYSDTVRCDIDCMFLGKVKNVLHTINGTGCEYKSSVIHNFLSMQSAGFISKAHAKHLICTTLKANGEEAKAVNHSKLLKAYYQTEDYKFAVRRFMKQASGRMSRTEHRRKEINIICDIELAELIAGDDSGVETLSHEYVAIREKAKEVSNFVFDQENKFSRMCLLARGRNSASKTLIMKTLSDFLNRKQSVKHNNLATLEEAYSALNDINNRDELVGFADSIATKMSLSTSYTARTKKQLVKLAKNETEALSESVEKIRDEIKSCTNEINKDLLKNVERWNRIRRQALVAPVLDREPVGDERQLYLELPNEANRYEYTGNPDGDSSEYRFFEKLPRNKKEVSFEASQMSALLKNQVVSEAFQKANVCTSWTTGKYMISPVIFTNVYKPVLSELACYAILRNTGFEVQELPLRHYESFDFIISVDGKKALLDVKFWNGLRGQKSNAPEKIRRTIKELGISKVLYLNTFSPNGEAPIRYTTPEGNLLSAEQASVMTVNGVINAETGVTIGNSIYSIKKWITG